MCALYGVWDSLAESTAREGTPSHAEMDRKLDALVDDDTSTGSKRVWHMQVPEHLVMAALEASIMELDSIVIRDVETLAKYESREEAIRSKAIAAQHEGFISLGCGVAIGDVLTKVPYCVEVCLGNTKEHWVDR